ncbi:odorant receptor 47b-like [Teleopsis dalmanni]|uniref:odorant receptor 47b-like n=1 Tax=Teleopsis dalmanni TaxID=139649 RepID=UPI0018CDDB9A|nr:odorant receptor 47b-like [Teleopsis dalmanni]
MDKSFNTFNKRIGYEYVGFEVLYAPFLATWKVLKQGRHPEHIFLVFPRNYLKCICLWLSASTVQSLTYRIINYIIMILLAIFTLTIACDLYEVSNDIVLFGDGLVVLTGLFLIYFKIWLFRSRADEMDSITNAFNIIHTKFSFGMEKKNPKILTYQRFAFLLDASVFTNFCILIIWFFMAISVQPLFTSETLIFRAKFPFSLHDPQRHPYAVTCIYFFQFFCTIYVLFVIVLIDSIPTQYFTQTSVSLKTLCECIRSLGKDDQVVNHVNMRSQLREIVHFHQLIIGLVDRINKCFYSNYIAQMGASTIIICLTAFESLLVKDELMVAIKFYIYMLSGFLQLFYWCFCGNRMYFDSVKVSTAAFGLHHWYNESLELQRDLMFLIQRAQKPLVFYAKPLPGFTFSTFTSILSTSYSYFTLLRTMNE